MEIIAGARGRAEMAKLGRNEIIFTEYIKVNLK